ncbi:nucleotide pyrophosphatase [Halobacteriales archaeon QS_5_68_33]|nr:MAG: nucleotide pyrophosphatase [Halobacteriales archaeon QS_5_68_33]
MLRTGVAEGILTAHGDGEAVFPAYEDYCFANVNPTLLSLLGADPRPERRLPEDALGGVEAVDRVVCLFLDGYGWEQWRRDHADVPLLSAFSERGTVTPLTTIYPSETAAATTTFHTGRTPVEHGLLGWWQYVDGVDAVVTSLPFLTTDGDPAGEVYDLRPEDMFDADPMYGRAAEAGVGSRLHQPVPGGPETAGAETVVYDSIPDLAVSLRRDVSDPDGPEYVYGYVPEVDAVAHRDGNGGERYRARLEMVTECLRRELVDRVDPGAAERTLFVVMADHGLVNTPPADNVDLTAAEWLWDALERDGDGDPIPPVGSPRNVHLFLRDGALAETRARIDDEFHPCRTFTRAEAVERGLFGDADPSALFERRCGDLVVVPRGRGTWWEDDELALAGMHGGLERAEMLVPLAAARLADLRG